MKAISASFPGGRGIRSLPSPQRVVSGLWRAYCYALATSPLATQAVTAASGFVAGDACAQIFSSERRSCRQRDGRLRSLEPAWQYDYARTARLALFGGLIAGPLGHIWFQMLDKRILPKTPKSVSAITLKCVMDQAFMAPLGCGLFYAFERSLAGQPEAVVPSLQAKFVPTLIASYKLWPAAHVLNFALVPPAYRVLYTQLVSVAWAKLLSGMSGRPSVALRAM